MNSRNRQIYFLAALSILAVGCGAIREERVATISRSWPATSVSRINVREVNGNVDVVAAPGREISLVAHVRSRGFRPDPARENQGYFETTVDGDTLTIGRRHSVRIRIPFLFSNDVTVDYDLRVPPSVALELKTVNGRIATRGVDGEMSAVTVNGAMDLETGGTKELVARTVNGRVKARFMHDFQGAQLKTVNGSIDAVLPPGASFACDLSQVNGDFEASFPLSIHSHPGRRRVSGEVNGGRFDLRITTVNGDIHVANGDGPAVTIPALPVPPVPGTPPAPPVAPATPPAPLPQQST